MSAAQGPYLRLCASSVTVSVMLLLLMLMPGSVHVLVEVTDLPYDISADRIPRPTMYQYSRNMSISANIETILSAIACSTRLA